MNHKKEGPIRVHNFTMRVTDDERELWEKEAKASGLLTTQFIRTAINEKIDRDRRIREYTAKVRGEFIDDDTELK